MTSGEVFDFFLSSSVIFIARNEQQWKFILLVYDRVDAVDIRARAACVVQEGLGLLQALARDRRIKDDSAQEPRAAGALRVLIRYHVECRLPDANLSICCDYSRGRFATALGEELKFARFAARLMRH